MKTLLSRLLPAALAVALLLTGCGQSAASPLDPQKPTTITVWTYYNGGQLDAFNALVEEFNTTVGKEQGIFVEAFSQGSVNDLETNVLAAADGKVGAGDMPNIFAAYADNAYALDQKGMVADLRPYFTDEELSAYVDSYVDEGRFSDDGSIKIFPIAKSTEIFLLNKTDWDVFAAATGAKPQDFATMEGLVATAQRYYEWTDSLTPQPNDGKAFFGRDAFANYMLLGAMQLGNEFFSVTNGEMTLQLDKAVMRKLWDNFYAPYIKGYFASSSRFRSDDVKTGNVIAFIGSSSGATFFPDHVIVSDTESYPIEMEVFPCPRFEDGQPYFVQQGAGMVVTTGTEEQVYASVQFLKWFTSDQRNITFSVDSGYLPVTKSANNLAAIQAQKPDLSPAMEQLLSVAVDTVNNSKLYTPKAFAQGTDARAILESSMRDLAKQDRETVLAKLAEGAALAEATAPFLTDDHFNGWFEDLQTQLEATAG